MSEIPIDDSELDKMAARSPEDLRDIRKSTRARVAERLDKIEAARANGWTLDQIADALKIKSGHILSAYISSIKIAEKKKIASPPVAAPAPPKFIPGQLPPIPGYEAPKPNMSPELAELARRAEERSAERRAAKAARESQPKE